jgi:hypothetical protein
MSKRSKRGSLLKHKIKQLRCLYHYFFLILVPYLIKLKRCKRDFISIPLTHPTKMSVSLKPNSIKHTNGNEYYLGDLPGTLQYKKTKEELTSIPNINNQDSDCGYVQVATTPELLKRFVPNTATGKKGDWDVLVVFTTSPASPETWMKAALRDKKTGLIALMTSTNKEENITSRGNRALQSLEKDWFVGFYRMGAPMVFWRALAAAVA